MSVENLLTDISAEMNVFKKARELFEKKLAPDFSVFNYINTDELMLSRIIADFLNPKGIHAQGKIFLKLFFEQFGLAEVWHDKELEAAGEVSVSVEVKTNLIEKKDRRMDILIKFKNPKYLLCIENKPFAADQYKQLEDYANQLHLSCEKNQQNWHLIYLSGYGSMPSESSIDKKALKHLQDSRNFSQLNYPDLVDWLRQCVAVCQNHQVVQFLNEFQSYILNVFTGVKDMSEQDAIVKLVTSDQKYIKAATEIFLAKNVIQDSLVQKLIQQLEEACKSKNFILKGELNRTNKAAVNIYYNNRPQKLCFKLVLEARNYGSCAIGLAICEENINYYNAELWQNIYRVMKNEFSSENVKGGASNKWWPFWIDQKDIWNWQAQHQVWPMIQSGKLCDRIMDYAERTYKALDDAKLLNQL